MSIRARKRVYSADYVFVCGLPRCGSSMTMQILSALGGRTSGKPPAHEIDEITDLPDETQWLKQYAGRAIKLLDPHRNTPPIDKLDAKYVLLTRNTREQAKSECKFLRALGGREVKKSVVKKIKRALDRDTQKNSKRSVKSRCRGRPRISVRGICALEYAAIVCSGARRVRRPLAVEDRRGCRRD